MEIILVKMFEYIVSDFVFCSVVGKTLASNAEDPGSINRSVLESF